MKAVNACQLKTYMTYIDTLLSIIWLMYTVCAGAGVFTCEYSICVCTHVHVWVQGYMWVVHMYVSVWKPE